MPRQALESHNKISPHRSHRAQLRLQCAKVGSVTHGGTQRDKGRKGGPRLCTLRRPSMRANAVQIQHSHHKNIRTCKHAPCTILTPNSVPFKRAPCLSKGHVIRLSVVRLPWGSVSATFRRWHGDTSAHEPLVDPSTQWPIAMVNRAATFRRWSGTPQLTATNEACRCPRGLDHAGLTTSCTPTEQRRRTCHETTAMRQPSA